MTTVNVYLYFQGNCEEAFNFYRSIFNKEFQYIGRYKDVPPQARQNFPNSTDEKIMHIALPISKETILMGADIIDKNDTNANSSNSFSLYIQTSSRQEADRLFTGLAHNGKIKMPLADQFWGSYYGICTDQFGINWKVSFSTDTSE